MSSKARYLMSLLATALIFIAINAISRFRVPPCCDFFYSYGFPVPFLIEGGFAGIRRFLCDGVFIDLCAVLVLAYFISWAWKRFLDRSSLISAQKVDPSNV
jgi:hypothetical protein